MESWFKPEFDAGKAGWKSGAAPFGGERNESRSALEMEERREVTAHWQHVLMTPRTLRIAQRREFPGERRRQRRPVALRTRHGLGLERIRLKNQPDADGLRLVRIVGHQHFDGAAEIGELRRNTGAGEPPAVAPEENRARLRWT